MRRKRKSLLPDTPLPVPSDILDQFVGQRPITPEELDAAVRRFLPSENRPERGFRTAPIRILDVRRRKNRRSTAQHTKFGQSQFNRPIFNPIAQSSIQSPNLQSNRPISNPIGQSSIPNAICNRQSAIVNC